MMSSELCRGCDKEITHAEAERVASLDAEKRSDRPYEVTHRPTHRVRQHTWWDRLRVESGHNRRGVVLQRSWQTCVTDDWQPRLEHRREMYPQTTKGTERDTHRHKARQTAYIYTKWNMKEQTKENYDRVELQHSGVELLAYTRRS